jgi:hypothetical protein
MTTDSPATTDTGGTAQPPESADAPGTKDGPACLEAGAAVGGLRSALVRPDDSLADLAARVRRLTERVRERGARR